MRACQTRLLGAPQAEFAVDEGRHLLIGGPVEHGRAPARLAPVRHPACEPGWSAGGGGGVADLGVGRRGREGPPPARGPPPPRHPPPPRARPPPPRGRPSRWSASFRAREVGLHESVETDPVSGVTVWARVSAGGALAWRWLRCSGGLRRWR